MKVILAGYNLDADVIRELHAKEPQRQNVTPETLSAAYARISRDPRPVNELREIARKEVEEARKSNQRIIFEMGHHSVAEHAVFNFDLIGISRLAIEAVERFRLCSFTEKSQRYIKLGEDFVVPREVTEAGLEGKFRETVKILFSCYEELFEALKKRGLREAGAIDGVKEKEIVNRAKEDARYVTPLATCGQLGLTVNARNLELMFRRFASHPLAELRELGARMFDEVRAIAPSIVIFTEANPYDRLAYEELAENLRDKHFITSALETNSSSATPSADTTPVKLIHCDKEAEERVLASLVHTVGALPFEEALRWVREKPTAVKFEILKAVSRHIQFYDAMLREFEHANLTYEVVLSAAAFGQMKRHRMATITPQSYDPSLGITIPSSIEKAGMTHVLLKGVEAAERTYREIAAKRGNFAHATSLTPQSYILTNAHRRRILITLNLRELYHISRLREDVHAQWDIRNIAALFSEEAKKRMPVVTALLGGKDRYPEIYRDIFGNYPESPLQNSEMRKPGNLWDIKPAEQHR